MKRSYLLCALGLSLLLFGGCGNQTEQMSYIGAEAAKQLALTSAGLTASSVESITTNLDSRNGLDYYEVDFTANGQVYQYDIDALTGAVIDTHSPSSTTEGSQQAAKAGSAITADEAKANALSHAGLTSNQVTFVKSKLDYENGRQVYEVEFYTQDQKEYDYEIDALTGEVIRYDYDTEYHGATAGNSMITADAAKEIALAQVPGATTDHIRKFKTDHDDGRTEYEGTILYNNMEYEFEIDGYSGAIRSWEAEPAGH